MHILTINLDLIESLQSGEVKEDSIWKYFSVVRPKKKWLGIFAISKERPIGWYRGEDGNEMYSEDAMKDYYNCFVKDGKVYELAQLTIKLKTGNYFYEHFKTNEEITKRREEIKALLKDVNLIDINL